MADEAPQVSPRLPGMTSGLDDAGRPWLRIADIELLDFIEDHLVERHDLDVLWSRTIAAADGTEAHELTFAPGTTERLRRALSELDPGELKWILSLNARPGTP